MPTFYDSKGESYVLNQQIGRGGEGTVFFCPNDLSLVAKIYHEPITDEKAEKLRWMADNKNEQLLKVAAWIVDTLHERQSEGDSRTLQFKKSPRSFS
jgi:DNA-binding helix-hairpin-helix protein with protein kinase domain